MNPMIVLAVVAMCAASAMASPAALSSLLVKKTACQAQSEKPKFETSIEKGDDYITQANKLINGYLQREENGATVYVPLKLERINGLYDSGEILHSYQEHFFIDVLNFDCANVEVLAKKTRVNVSVNFVLPQMEFTFNGKHESCRLSPSYLEPGNYSFLCMSEDNKIIASLVFERFGLDKFLPMELPENYPVTWY